MTFLCPFCQLEYTLDEPCFCQPRVSTAVAATQARSEEKVSGRPVAGAALAVVLPARALIAPKAVPPA